MTNLYILVGNIGSGKSTFAKQMLGSPEIICQDVLGSRENCLKAAHQNLNQSKSIVIDRTNISKKQRKYWINLQNDYEIRIHCIEFKVPKEMCLERVLKRQNHPTIKNMSKKKIESIIERFEKEYEKPEMSEGFDSYILMVDEFPSPN